MKKIMFLVFALSSAAFAVSGVGGIGLAFGVPQSEYRDNIDRLGFGVSLDVAAKTTPYFALGGALGFMSYGSEKRNEPFSTTIPDVFVEVTTSNNFMFFQLMPRIYAPLPIIKPYIEGRAGFNYLWTDTRIEDIGSDEEIASSTNIDDITFCYGAGGGFLIEVWHEPSSKNERDISDSPDAVYIDLKAIYVRGGNAEYLKEGSISNDGHGNVIYDISESRTDMLTISVGVAIEF